MMQTVKEDLLLYGTLPDFSGAYFLELYHVC